MLPQDAEPLLKIAKDLKLNLVGVSFYVGSCSEEPEAFYRAISAAKKVCCLKYMNSLFDLIIE